MTVKSIDRAAMIDLRPEIERALAELGNRWGITFKVGAGHYATTKGDFKLEMTVRETTDGKSGEQADFEKLASRYGLSPTDYNRSFTHDHREYRLVGFQPSRPKYSCRARQVETGRELLFSADTVRMCLGYMPAVAARRRF